VADIKDLISRIDLHDLADRLGMTRPMARGNYQSPHHKDKNPSVSIYDSPNGPRWKDHSSEGGGSCIDLVMYVEGCDVPEASRRLHDMYGIARDLPTKEKKQLSKIEWLAEQVLRNAKKSTEYLIGRGISQPVIDNCIKRRTLGFNDWTSDKVAEYQPGHGGAAPAFIVRTMNPGSVVAVDFRYLDPELNGGVKTQTQGEKAGHVWYADLQSLKKAHTVVVCESPINAMSVETIGRYGLTAVATRGVNVEAIDWHFLSGKRVVICMDADLPDAKGKRPGVEASWKLLEILTGLNIAAHLVDQEQWYEDELNDLNDVLMAGNATDLRVRLDKIQPWAIPGVIGKGEPVGKSRLFLPAHDLNQYWKFRCKEDFTTFVAKLNGDSEGDGQQEIFADLCGFRVAGVTRVTVASAVAAMTGEKDNDAKTMFSVAVQLPRHKNKLIRKVFDDEKLHNLDLWRKFGPVFNQASFSRMVSILERGAELGARNAVNFVGLAWRDGKPIVNEGPDCYFTDAAKQCPYSGLTFPTGDKANARVVIDAYQATFKDNAALMMLVWALGGHLKAFLGFWPHMTLQADKGKGKTTLAKRLERSIGMTLFSGQSLQTEFRLLTSISHTSHPVGWEELSARSQKVIDQAVSLLQEAYQSVDTKRGSDMTSYLVSAPVLLVGEDVPVKSLTGKLVRTNLVQRGPMLDDELPVFPVRPWLEFLATKTRRDVREMHDNALTWALDQSRAPADDDGARRMSYNYAGFMVAWRLLCEFSGISVHQGDFLQSAVKEMNEHIAETSADREPWVWILDTILSEMDAGQFRYPYTFDDVRLAPGEGNEICLFVRTSHIMDHLAHTPALRDKWNALPVKSDRVFKRQLIGSGVVVKEDAEKVIGSKRSAHMVAISVKRMGQFGLHAMIDKDQFVDC